MKYVLPTAITLSLVALAGCERPTSTSSTTVVKEPTTVVQPTVKEKETTIVQAPAPAPVEPAKPEPTVERSKTTTTERVDTPMGSATRTETTRTTKQ